MVETEIHASVEDRALSSRLFLNIVYRRIDFCLLYTILVVILRFFGQLKAKVIFEEINKINICML